MLNVFPKQKERIFVTFGIISVIIVLYFTQFLIGDEFQHQGDWKILISWFGHRDWAHYESNMQGLVIVSIMTFRRVGTITSIILAIFCGIGSELLASFIFAPLLSINAEGLGSSACIIGLASIGITHISYDLLKKKYVLNFRDDKDVISSLIVIVLILLMISAIIATIYADIYNFYSVSNYSAQQGYPLGDLLPGTWLMQHTSAAIIGFFLTIILIRLEKISQSSIMDK